MFFRVIQEKLTYSWNRKIVYPLFLAIFEKIGQFFVMRFLPLFLENNVYTAV